MRLVQKLQQFGEWQRCVAPHRPWAVRAETGVESL